MNNPNYVWYASYGSNLSESRFLCYIQGGKPRGSDTEYKGCSDTNPPLASKPLSISGDLYFAERSATWDGGGVGFLEMNGDTQSFVLGRMYLITEEQFWQVVKQENGGMKIAAANLQEMSDSGSFVFRKRWYGKILHLGDTDGYPIFTFTNKGIVSPINKPNERYLENIIEGIQETYQSMTSQEIADYLMAKKGIDGQYTREQIESLIPDRPQ